MQPQELEPSSSLSSSSPRETNPVLHAFMHLSKEAKRQYPRGLRLLFDYLKIPASDLEERAQAFLHKAKEDPQWAQDSITYFLVFHNERVNIREIAPGTLKNFCLSIKLFCDMHDLTTWLCGG